MTTIRRSLSPEVAGLLLTELAQAIERISAIPPGDLRRDRDDPQFRAATTRCVNTYRDAAQSPQDRFATVGGVIYQVRCSLMHGAKDPFDARDCMLVEESLVILRALVPALEEEPS
jgi:hypothetical protein